MMTKNFEPQEKKKKKERKGDESVGAPDTCVCVCGCVATPHIHYNFPSKTLFLQTPTDEFPLHCTQLWTDKLKQMYYFFLFVLEFCKDQLYSHIFLVFLMFIKKTSLKL